MGSRAGFDEFVAARGMSLVRIAFLLTRDWALAEDLVQTALARAWLGWGRIAGAPEPYVRKIIVNTYASWWRRRWNAEEPHSHVPDDVAVDPHTGHEDRDVLWQALGRLPKRQRAVVVLRYFEDLSETEVGDVLGCSVGTVKSQTHRALAKLRIDPALTETEGALRNLTDLRGVLTAHSEPEADRPRPQAWLPDIERKAHRIRRRRASVAVVTLAFVIAGVAVAPRLGDLRADDGTERTTDQLRLLDSFPEYAVGWHSRGATSGTRLVASEVADIAERSVSVTVSGRRELAMAFVCDTPGELTLTVKITVADREYIHLCPRPESAGPTAPEVLTDGATLGDPVTFTLTVLNATNMDSSAWETLPVPEEGSLALAIYETVPFEAYEFPPRPETLKPLLDPVDEADRQAYELDHIASRPDDPLAPQRIELIMPDSLWLEVIMERRDGSISSSTGSRRASTSRLTTMPLLPVYGGCPHLLISRSMGWS